MFEVRVADNFHYMDEDEVYTHGSFSTWADAVVAARKLVDNFLTQNLKPGMTADDLYQYYTSFGDDPFITPVPDGEKFSAWDYARERCGQLCGSAEDDTRLSPPLVARVRAIAHALRDVNPKTEAEWIAGFAEDWRPEREIAIWEVMALAYSSFVAGRKFSGEAKMEALQVALRKSFGRTDAEVITEPTTVLTEADRRELVAHFTAAARTLGMLDAFA